VPPAQGFEPQRWHSQSLGTPQPLQLAFAHRPALLDGKRDAHHFITFVVQLSIFAEVTNLEVII
jgi:hypothetical protein